MSRTGRPPLPAINPNRIDNGSRSQVGRRRARQPVEGSRPLMKIGFAHRAHVLCRSSMLAGCSSYRPAPAAFHEALDAALPARRRRPHPRHRVRAGRPDQHLRVDQSGYIAFPLVGAVPARGHTAQQIEATLAAKLREGYLRDPDVSVEIDRYRPIFVMGEVGAAGQYSYVPGPDRPEGDRDRRRLLAARQPGQTSTSPATSTARS